MTRSRRPPRRQGVVYGPVQDRGQGYEASSLVGLILGMLVVAAALGILAVGALTFTGGRGGVPVASSTPTALAVQSPVPTVQLTAPRATAAPPVTAPPTAALPTPLLSPDSTGSPQPTAGATPFELEVGQGPGFVTFGTQSDSSLRIIDPRTSFGPDERITWSAYLTELVNSDETRIEISKIDPATGAEELVRQEEVRPRVTAGQIFLRRIRPDQSLDGPGIYVVRYLRGFTVMSEGFLEIRSE